MCRTISYCVLSGTTTFVLAANDCTHSGHRRSCAGTQECQLHQRQLVSPQERGSPARPQAAKSLTSRAHLQLMSQPSRQPMSSSTGHAVRESCLSVSGSRFNQVAPDGYHAKQLEVCAGQVHSGSAHSVDLQEIDELGPGGRSPKQPRPQIIDLPRHAPPVASAELEDINAALDLLELTYAAPSHRPQTVRVEEQEAAALEQVLNHRDRKPAQPPHPAKPAQRFPLYDSHDSHRNSAAERHPAGVPAATSVYQRVDVNGRLALGVNDMTDTASRVQQLLCLALHTSGNRGATPVLWYFSHFWGRSEIVRMALVFGGIDFIFAGFNNAEREQLSPLLAEHDIDTSNGFPMLQIDGLSLSLEIPVCRYVAQRSELYPDSSNLAAVHTVEAVIVRAEELFDQMIKMHYKKFNTVGGGKAQYSAQDESNYAATLSSSVLKTFKYFQTVLHKFAGHYLVGDALTIADIIVCHYRYILGQGEFQHITAAHFVSEDLRVFERYYAAMLEKHFAQYFASRYGSTGDVQATHVSQLVEHEGTGGSWFPIPLTHPFSW